MREHHDPKSIGQLINDQCVKWEARAKMFKQGEIYRPVLILSGQVGTIARGVAQRLSTELRMDLFDEEIIRAIAQEAHLSERMVRTMDERGWTYAEEILNRLMGTSGMSAEAYFRHLVHVMVTIARHGNSIIVGHGAAYILRAPMNLHVRFVAPPSLRIQRVSEEFGIPEQEAERRIRILDQERREFVRQYFHTDVDDVSHFDLVINTEFVDSDLVVRTVKDAFLGKSWNWANRKWKPKQGAANQEPQSSSAAPR